MVIQKAVMYKILAVVLALSILIGCSESVEAAVEKKTGTFVYNGNTYTYEYVNTVYSGLDTLQFSTSIYNLMVAVPNGSTVLVVSVSDDYFTFTDKHGTVFNSNVDSRNNVEFYDFLIHVAYNNLDSHSVNWVLNTDIGNGVVESFLNYFVSDDFDDLLFSPDWSSIGTDSLFMINNLQAEIQDGNIVVTWEPQLYLPYRIMQHMYIRFGYAARTPGTVTTTSGRNRYIDIDKYAKMSDCSITIPLSDLTLLGDRYVSSLLATPYYYIGDNLENETRKGQNTLVYFDEQGVSSAPIIVDSEVTDEIPQENVEMNIFQSIQNFFSGFFRNLMNTIKSAVVPESGDVLALLQEMNDWFSERFGFIWYPFDLAIDIVGAFALGEADSKFTVPALTINILGGIKLWDSFEADLDPIGFLQYVRFFTSTIMCCGTVSLAIRKWDEWIGGEH